MEGRDVPLEDVHCILAMDARAEEPYMMGMRVVLSYTDIYRYRSSESTTFAGYFAVSLA